MASKTTERRARGTKAMPVTGRWTAAVRPLRRWLLLGALVIVAVVAAVWYLTPGTGSSAAIGTLQTTDFHSLALSPTDPNVVFFGHHNGMLRSADGGRTWRPVLERPNFDAMGLAINRQDARQMYLAGHEVFQSSTDGGATWRPVEHNLPSTDIHGFALSPGDPSRLYAFVVGHGLFQSADSGRTWQGLSGRPPMDVMGLVAAGGNPETLYVSSMRAGVLRSTDGGQTWGSAMNGLDSRAVSALAVDPTSRQTLFAGGDGGLYRTADGGGTWTKLPFPGENAVALAVSPVSPNVLLAITAKDGKGLVYRSEDGGQSWGGRR
ncbi:MAG: hypothetical protein HY329_27020 [Chloroflexi bacterium]|nr:hypothetical protein [Chloroflexota bacterium]